MTDIEHYLENLITKVCSDLTSMYPAGELSGAEERLIFPHKRDGTLRISEQEAKLVFIRHLEADKRSYCVEYPTIQTYQQKGTTPMSARVDLTIIGEKRTAVAHVELKAHNCTHEAIRKDLEKLLREKTTGCWFHTLERADRVTLRALRAKFRSAFSALAEYFPTDPSAYLIAFFVLDVAHLESRWLRFTGNESEDHAMLDAAFIAEDANFGWATSRF